MSKYVYDRNLNYICSTYEEIKDEDILKSYPNSYIINEFIEFPKLYKGKIISKTNLEIEEYKLKKYKKNEYKLKENEIIIGSRVIEYIAKKYEYIENGVVLFDYESKRNDLLEQTKIYEIEEKEKSFMFKGYLQPNRELEDQTSLLKIMTVMQITKQTHFNNWKMKDADGHEHYIDLTIQDIMKLSQLMQEQTTKAMIKWSNIRENIKSMSDEELKEYTLLKVEI